MSSLNASITNIDTAQEAPIEIYNMKHSKPSKPDEKEKLKQLEALPELPTASPKENPKHSEQK